MDYLKKFKNKLTDKEIDYIKYGKKEFEFFVEDIKKALTKNRFGEHYMWSSLPGFGKTWTVEDIAEALGIDLVKFDGSVGLYAFMADVAFILNNAPNDDSKIYCKFDDADGLFEKKDELNAVKGIFDEKRRVLSYSKSTGPAYYSLDDFQKEALDKFKVPGRSGFTIPMDRFVFLVLTNKWFPTTTDVENASISKQDLYRGLAAIRRRVRYKDIKFDEGVDWGYCVHMLMEKPICEKSFPEITFAQKLEIISFTSPLTNWSKLEERNLSTFDKMTKDMVEYPNDYKNKWHSNYLKKN